MQMLIDGVWVGSADSKVDEVRNPATGAFIDSVPSASETDVERAVAAAQEGRKRMARMPAHQRASILLHVADRIEAEQDELATLLCSENGKTRREIVGEINAAIRIWRGYAEEAKRLFGKAIPLDSVPGNEESIAITIRQPLGVVVAIVPFNYPVELWSHKAAGALAAGNAVITKPPEQCPLTVLRIASYMEEAGLPRGAHQVVTGPGETVGAALVRADGVQLITMTGSTEAGRHIARAAAETLKKVHLELGGNDATIVCDDADPQAVASDLIAGRFTSGNGQICCAVKRVLVDESIHDAVLDALLAKTQSLQMGDPLSDDTDVGPLISEEAAIGVDRQVEKAVADGAKVATGGTRNGTFYTPTILTQVGSDNIAFRDEVFGPVLALTPFKDFTDAIALTNDSRYGLQAAIYTRDVGRIMQAFRQLDVGTVVVNHATNIRMENLPFGGTKLSGNAREGLHETLLDMTEQKTLLMSDVFLASAE